MRGSATSSQEARPLWTGLEGVGDHGTPWHVERPRDLRTRGGEGGAQPPLHTPGPAVADTPQKANLPETSLRLARSSSPPWHQPRNTTHRHHTGGDCVVSGHCTRASQAEPGLCDWEQSRYVGFGARMASSLDTPFPHPQESPASPRRTGAVWWPHTVSPGSAGTAVDTGRTTRYTNRHNRTTPLHSTGHREYHTVPPRAACSVQRESFHPPMNRKHKLDASHTACTPPPLLCAGTMAGKRREDGLPMLRQGRACAWPRVRQRKSTSTPAHTPLKPKVSQRGTTQEYAGKIQHLLDVITTHQGIRSYGTEALSKLAPPLKQGHMLAL